MKSRFSLQPLAFSLALVVALISGCTTTAAPPKPVAAYVSIDDAFPTFNLQKKGNPANVQIVATREQLARWTAAANAYAAAQKEIETAVNHYEPLKIKSAIATRKLLITPRPAP